VGAVARNSGSSAWLRLAALAGMAVGIGMAGGTAVAADGDVSRGYDTRLHALSLLGAPAHGPDFKHFSWVNPDAPKAGTVRHWAQGTFDSLNPFTVRGVPAIGSALIYDQLMVTSPDEPSTEYCLVCEWVSYPEDYSSVTFGLRESAKFHDGHPITPEDVIFSLEAMKKAHPQYAYYYKNVVSAEKTGEREVTFKFDVKRNRELPLIVGQIAVVPKHYWEAKNEKGEQRDFTKSTLELPLGSGPYRIKKVDAGRSITYERVEDYWAKDLPAALGQWNFNELRFDYYRERTPAFEAFKSGKIDVWQESTASAWAMQYNFPAVKKGFVKREDIPHSRVAGMQAFVLNQRRPAFQDIRVRKAFNLAFNFTELNKAVAYGMYVRTDSYWDNSELGSSGLPEGKELEILETVRDLVPPEVFTTEWKNPEPKTGMDHRKNLRQAMKLLREAGWTQQGSVLKNAKGETLDIEFLLVQQAFQNWVLPYKQDLEKLGVKVRVRLVDSSQYRRRIDSFDFDVIVDSFPQSHSPGNEQRNYWGTAAADRSGSDNTPGIKSKAIDKLIDAVVFAKDRETLVAASRALDRVLLWGHYVVPQWHYPYDRWAYWDMFGRPEKLPSQQAAMLRTWWIDEAKLKALPEMRGM